MGVYIYQTGTAQQWLLNLQHHDPQLSSSLRAKCIFFTDWIEVAVDRAALKFAATSQKDAARILVHLADHASAASCAVAHSDHCAPHSRIPTHADGQQCGDIGRCQLHPVPRISAARGHGTELPEAR